MKKMNPPAQEPILTSSFLVVFLINLIIAATQQMYNATISLNIIDSLGYGTSTTGMMISVGAMAATVTRFFGGRFCETFGRRRLVVLGLVIWGAASFAMGGVDQLSALYVLRVIQATGSAAASAAIAVAVVDVIPKARMSEGIGYYSLAASLGQAFGPSLALSLYATPAGFAAVAQVICLISLLGALFAALFLTYEKKKGYRARASEPAKAQTSAPAKASDNPAYTGLWKYIEKRALPVAICNCVSSFAGSLSVLYLTLYATRVGIGNAGLYFTLSAFTMVAARLFSGKLSDRYGPLYAVVPGYLLSVTGYVMLIFSPGCHLLYYLSGFIAGFGGGMTIHAMNAAAVLSVEPERVSIASSTYTVPIEISSVTASLVWGALIDAMEFQYVILVGIGFYLLALLMAILIFRSKQRRTAG